MKCKSKIIKIIEDTIAIEDDGTDEVLLDHDETVYDLKVKTIPASSYALLVKKDKSTKNLLILFNSKLYWIHEEVNCGIENL